MTTKFGQAFVFAITFLSIGFLSISTMVFLTERDWKKEVARIKTEQAKLSTALQTQQGLKTQAEADLQTAQKQHRAQVGEMEAKITNLNAQNKTQIGAIGDSRKAIETAQQNVKATQTNAEAKDAETAKIREQLRIVEAEANAYRTQQSELKDQLKAFERFVEQAEVNNKKLRADNSM